jgi:hypothetical protein
VLFVLSFMAQEGLKPYSFNIRGNAGILQEFFTFAICAGE